MNTWRDSNVSLIHFEEPMQKHVCYKCGKQEMPFLDDDEFDSLLQFWPKRPIEEIRQYHLRHGCSLLEARLRFAIKLMKKFEEITGVADVPYETIFHHRRSDWGPQCKGCGYLLRTPKASYCVECGLDR